MASTGAAPGRHRTPDRPRASHEPEAMDSDDVRLRDLRRMKRRATGLLAATAAVFLLTFALPDTTAVGFLRSAAEAGMVGGLADWFAVTALFRRPLGLPIPHTALVPTRKDALAENLGQFVTGHFLTRDTLHARLAEARLPARLGAALATPAVAERLSKEATTAAVAALSSLRPDDLTEAALELARRDVAARSYACLLGRFLADRVEGGAHRPLVDLVLPYLRTSLSENRATLRVHLQDLGDGMGVLASLFVTAKRADRLLGGVIELLRAMEDDPHHQLRGVLERFLRSLATDLQQDPELAARVDRLLGDVLDDPQTQNWLSGIVDGALQTAQTALATPDSALRQRLTRLLMELGTRAVEDAEFQARLQRWSEQSVMYLVDNYAEEFTRLVRDTVAGWDGPATAHRIELAAGRDLQFIRVNGTVVGALAGLVIHAVAVLLG
ncbi:DUF445 domain-containing protein [Motilibacter aurantiacus]|uniref:DUF445 domain-containing protein n=1 Tax=Motilibacter aurantiacus TaxID=2714955 RepID=UPI00140B22B8|nr:DUF445 domain-containing protein [Motilibacter aurantiacus]NHC43775.1 DUF445 domain-containing protein [Motilibacter aurantiacus]